MRGAKVMISLMAAGMALWILWAAWFKLYPEKRLIKLGRKLLRHLAGDRTVKLHGEWVALCNLIKKGVSADDVAVTQRGIEVLKLFVGEYFRCAKGDPNLTEAIYRELVSLYAVTINKREEITLEIIVALRVAARGLMGKNDVLFHDITRQFTVCGLLALNEGRFFVAAKIVDQLFMLLFKGADKDLAAPRAMLFDAIAVLGRGAVKRRDIGLVREIINRLLTAREAQGRIVHEALYMMLLKSVSLGFEDMIDLTLEASKDVFFTECGPDALQTIRVWSEAAKTAALKQDQESLHKISVCFLQVADERLSDEPLIRLLMDEFFGILQQLLRQRDSAEHGFLLAPVLEMGYNYVLRELQYKLPQMTLQDHQFGLKYLLDKLLQLGALLTRDGQLTTGMWISGLYQQWLALPDNKYRKTGMLKFVQLWLLYWANSQRRSAKRQGGLPENIFEQSVISDSELARFPKLCIRERHI